MRPPPERRLSDGIDTFTRWLWGVVPEVLLAAYALHCIVVQDAVMIGTRRGFGRMMHVHGATAIVLGLAYLALAALGHFHFFWGEHPRLAKHAGPGRAISLAVLAGGLLYVIFSVLLFP